jgi:CHAD domain-containing protein
MLDESLLREPAERGVRLVALSLLADAQEACNALTSASRELRDGDATGDEALHAFRVAVRRLRSWLRVFNPLLRESVSRKQRGRLSDIADATSASRDATVHLDWLRKGMDTLTARQRVGYDWLCERLEAQRQDGSDLALAAAEDFHATAAKLERRLNVYRATVLTSQPPAQFGALLADRVLEESELLHDHLAAIHQITDVEEAHRARIAAKRLRYVVEPVSPFVSNGDVIIEALKALQDSLGDLHDVHVFSEELVTAAEEAAAAQARRVLEVLLGEAAEDETKDERLRRARASDPGPGLIKIARTLHERGARAYADIERGWLHDAGASFFDRVSRFAGVISQHASLGTELERAQ